MDIAYNLFKVNHTIFDVEDLYQFQVRGGRTYPKKDNERVCVWNRIVITIFVELCNELQLQHGDLFTTFSPFYDYMNLDRNIFNGAYMFQVLTIARPHRYGYETNMNQMTTMGITTTVNISKSKTSI